ncbi:hypothetical protein U0070_007091, partial [Myodes glareolus]
VSCPLACTIRRVGRWVGLSHRATPRASRPIPPPPPESRWGGRVGEGPLITLCSRTEGTSLLDKRPAHALTFPNMTLSLTSFRTSSKCHPVRKPIFDYFI